MIDQNTQDIVSKYVANILYELGKKSLDAGNKTIRNLRMHKGSIFESYYKAAIDKYSYSKTIFNPTVPVHIDDIYVDLDIKKHQHHKIVADSLGKIANINKHIVLTGTAGSGKSTLLKKLFLNAVKNNERIPLLVELRTLKLDDDSECDLLSAILNSLQWLHFDLSYEEFDKLLCTGDVILLFDGFDELSIEQQDILESKLVKLRDKYNQTPIFITSRPSNRFSGWNNFTEYFICELNKSKIIELISNIDYEPDIKNMFIDNINKGLYETHKSFLSNPLLLTIMLLTFTQYAEIPKKIHLFYQRAFEALFQTHDATKSGFKRNFASKLPMDEFKDVLSSFSLLTYVDSVYTFTETDVYDYLSRCKKISRFEEFNEGDFFHDMLQSVCIIVKDGLFYTFTHRSFQEYFTAEFILNSRPDIRKKLLYKVGSRAQNDNVFHIIYERNKYVLENDFLIHFINDIKNQFNGKYDLSIQMLDFVFKEVTLDDCSFDSEDGHIAFVPKDSFYHSVLGFIKNRYLNQDSYLLYRSIQSRKACKNLCDKLVERSDVDSYEKNDEVFFDLRSILNDDELSSFLILCAEIILDQYNEMLNLPDKLYQEHCLYSTNIDDLLST